MQTMQTLYANNEEDRSMAGYDEKLAEEALIALNKSFPYPVTTAELKHALGTEPSDDALLTALDALQLEGWISGKYLRSQRQLVAMANIQITAEGRRKVAGDSERSAGPVIHGDQINNYGQAGALGRYATGTINYQQQWTAIQDQVDLVELARELERMRSEVQKTASSRADFMQLGVLAEAEEPLQRVRGDARVAELARGAGGRGEALDHIAVPLRTLPNAFERTCLSTSGPALQTLYTVTGSEYLFDGVALRGVEMRASLRERNSLLDRHELRGAPSPIQYRLDDFFLGLDHLGSCQLARCIVLFARNELELAGSNARLEARANLRVGRFSHAAPHRIDKQGPLILNSFALETTVARERQRGVRLLLTLLGHWFLCLADAPLSCLGNYMIGLVAKVGGNLPVRRQRFVGRQNHLLVAGVVSRNLRRFRATESTVRKGFLDLLTPWAGGIKILLRVSLDLWRAALARLDFVAEIAEPVRQLRLIHGGCVALRGEKATLLKRAHLAVFALGHPLLHG
jgi:hypothetical protein